MQTNAILRDYDGVFCVESFNPVLVKNSDPSFLRGQLGSWVAAKHVPSLLGRILLHNFITNIVSKPHFVAICITHWTMSLVRFVPVFWKDIPLILWTVQSEKDALQARNDPRITAVIFEGFLPLI